MPNVNDMFPSEFLKCSDLKGKAHRLTMERMEQKELGGENKWVLYFDNKEKGLVLNKTNAMMISASFGADSADWMGKSLEVYPDKTMFQGRPTDCIRVRAEVPPAAESDGEEVPF